MADDIRQNLTDLASRTATADTDLIHVNSGESDYKQTKQNFLRGNLAHQFANNSTLTSQLDTLASAIGFGTIHGDISSNGHQTETGMPVNSNGTVFARIFSTGQMSVSFFPNAVSDEYVIFKQGTWGTWEKQPTRAEISALNNSLTNSLLIGTPVTAQVSLSASGMQSADISDLSSPPSISGYVHQYWVLVSSTYRFTPVGYGGTRVYYWVGTTSTSSGSMMCYPIYKKNA